MYRRSNCATVDVSRLPLKRRHAADWDAFAGEAGGSFQVCFDHVAAQATKGLGRERVHLLECRLDGTKIAQCVAIQRGAHIRIQDGLQIPEAHKDLWPAAMAAVLENLGPGTYSYGGLWSCETPKDAELSALHGVAIRNVRPLAVQAVEFSKWPSFDRYWAKVSDSVRYESKYAPERVPGLKLTEYRGRDMLKTIWPIVDLQNSSYARKDLSYGRMKNFVRYAYYMMVARRSLTVVLAEGDDGVLAYYYGTRLGRDTFYIYGGQKAGSSGANWYLLKMMTQQAFEHDPNGRFVMGNVDYSIHDEVKGGGLLRARRALRVSDLPTAIVDFEYR